VKPLAFIGRALPFATEPDQRERREKTPAALAASLAAPAK